MAPLASLECESCGGRHRIQHPILGVIRCPHCTSRPRNDRQAMAALTRNERTQFSAAEIARIERVVSQLIAISRYADAQVPSVPEHLAPTDRILQRWAAEGTGLPAENPDAYRTARPPRLDPITFAVVDRIVMTSTRSIRTLILSWYLSPVPTVVLANERRKSVRSLVRYWHLALVEIRGRFLASGHTDLIALTRLRV